MKKIKNQEQKDEKGITLVALVVTIVVLIILAGITLTLVLGQNGIVNKAKEARDKTQADQLNTEIGMNSLYDEIITATGEQAGGTTTPIATAIGKKLSDTDNIAIKDDEGNTVTIPAGFKVASDSPTKQENGIVIEDKDGNQYVWIPVANIANYVRTDYGSSFDANGYSSYSETMPSDEQTSVGKYKGYYIGRYEAGDSVSTASKKLRAGGSVTNKVSIQKGQAPYNDVTRDQAKTLAEGIKTAEGYTATTKLCSSYAWDTAINFLQSKVSNYGTSSNQGNYNDTTFTYTDITGASQTKASSSSVIIPTGQTTPVCSIYDMGGNDWEWTTEVSSVSGTPCVVRGGFCDYTYSTMPAGFRGNFSTSEYYVGIAFRPTLYM